MKREESIDRIIESAKKIERAQPSATLFDKIENTLFRQEAQVIPLNWLRAASIAAALIVGFNIYGVINYEKTNNSTDTSVASSTSPIISNYNLYE